MEKTAQKPLTQLEFGGSPITSPMAHQGDSVTFTAGNCFVTLFSEGTSVVIEKRPSKNSPTQEVQDTASYNRNGELEGVALGQLGPYLPGGTFKTTGADGSYKLINPDIAPGEHLDVAVRARGIVVWRAFKSLEAQLKEIRAHPVVAQILHGEQAQSF